VALWVVRAGSKGQQESEAIENSVVTIGWNDLPDISHLHDKEKFEALYRQRYSEEISTVRRNMKQILDFVNSVKIGDTVALPLLSKKLKGKDKEVLLGKVEGNYEFGQLSSNIKHYRRVLWVQPGIRWLDLSKKTRQYLGFHQTVYNIKEASVEREIGDYLSRFGFGDEGKYSQLDTIRHESEKYDLQFNNITKGMEEGFSITDGTITVYGNVLHSRMKEQIYQGMKKNLHHFYEDNIDHSFMVIADELTNHLLFIPYKILKEGIRERTGPDGRINWNFNIDRPSGSRTRYRLLKKGGGEIPLEDKYIDNVSVLFEDFLNAAANGEFTKYWIFVVTDNSEAKLSAKEIYNMRMGDMFWGLHERTPYRVSLKEGDKIIFSYGSRELFGLATLASNSYELGSEESEQVSHGQSFFKAKFGVKLRDIVRWDQPKRVDQFLEVLPFVKDKTKYPVYFQGGVKKISKEAYEMITGNHVRESSWLSLTRSDIDEITSLVLNADGKRLEIDPGIVKRIIHHLLAGKHVILEGPPGTGKTDLAIRLLRELGRRIIGTAEPVKAVASYEWGRYEVIGGNKLSTLQNEDNFHLGCVTKAIRNHRFLLIDEFNRADMNKAFGEMFLALDHDVIDLREDEEPNWLTKEEKVANQIFIPPEFRMICTMNDYDKSLLNELSYGLLRRFAFVEIDNPNEKEKEESVVRERIIRELGEREMKIEEKAFDNISQQENAFMNFIMKARGFRKFGVSTSIDVIRYLITSTAVTNEDPWILLDSALTDYVLPQVDRLDLGTLRGILESARIAFNNKEGKPVPVIEAGFIRKLEALISKLEQVNKLFVSDEASLER
jgi:MoxR-like ATPase